MSSTPVSLDSATLAGRHPKTLLIPWAFLAMTILGHISWVLAGSARTAITIATVVTFFLASATHALLTRGLRWTAGYLAVSLGLGLAVEAVGRSTGFPFGVYDYTDSLGAKILGVPVVIPLAWAMMAYPALLAGQRLSRSRWFATVIGAWLLATWDLFLDPQMVAEGHWIWADPTPALWGVPGIPIGNYLGWLLTALAMMALLNLLPRTSTAHDGVPVAALAWVYASNVLANAAFFGRPAVALWGGALMGLAVIPWALRVWSDRDRRASTRQRSIA
jgi:carotene biosynthesis associated membrane protein